MYINILQNLSLVESLGLEDIDLESLGFEINMDYVFTNESAKLNIFHICNDMYVVIVVIIMFTKFTHYT